MTHKYNIEISLVIKKQKHYRFENLTVGFESWTCYLQLCDLGQVSYLLSYLSHQMVSTSEDCCEGYLGQHKLSIAVPGTWWPYTY